MALCDPNVNPRPVEFLIEKTRQEIVNHAGGQKERPGRPVGDPAGRPHFVFERCV